MRNDPGFIAEAKKQRLEIEEVDGEHLARSIAETFALPRERIEAAKAALAGVK